MNIIRPLGALLVLALLPACSFAQAQPPRFVGDDASFGTNLVDRLGLNGSRSSSNNGALSDLANAGGAGNVPNDGAAPVDYYRARRDANGQIITPIQFEKRTLNYPISASDWLAFVREHVNRNDPGVPANQRFPDVDYNGVDDRTQRGTVTPLSFDAPRNKVAVIDQGVRKDRIDRGLPPEVFTTRLVTVVTRWVDVYPIYSSQCVTAYPCCCTQCFSYLSGYNSVPRVQTTYEYRPVADYPTTEIAVDRGIVMQQGNPQYTTQVPRLCEFHYGAGAKIVLPTVPLVTDGADVPTTTRLAVTVTGSGTTSTEITAPMISPLVEGSQPRGNGYGGLTLTNGRKVAPLTASPADRGTNTFTNDTATVAEVVARGERNQPYTYHETAP